MLIVPLSTHCVCRTSRHCQRAKMWWPTAAVVAGLGGALIATIVVVLGVKIAFGVWLFRPRPSGSQRDYGLGPLLAIVGSGGFVLSMIIVFVLSRYISDWPIGSFFFAALLHFAVPAAGVKLYEYCKYTYLR